MNERQAKKKFKKKYGCNPDEFMVNFGSVLEDMSKMCNDICEAMPKVIDSICETIRGVNEFVQSDEFKKIAQAVSELAKETEEEEARAADHGVIYSEDVVEKIVKPLNQEQKRWIPVSESLPEESLNSVIGWDAYRERCVFVQYIDGYFQITGSDESFDIVAWMPVPEPYEAESYPWEKWLYPNRKENK